MSKHTPGTWEVAPATVQVSVPCDNGGGRRNVQMHSVQSTAFSAGGRGTLTAPRGVRRKPCI